MALTQSQRAIIEKARQLGGGQQAIALTDEACTYLVAAIARDLSLAPKFPELPKRVPAFFGPNPARLRLDGDCSVLMERLFRLVPDADTYFSCLAALHKARLKYERILQTQPVPTIDQVGPRGLLQYGGMRAKALTGFLLWRKWIFDIDNRAGQETGYLFEPIIASAIGGVPASAKKSPIRRRSDHTKGRQVDCLLDKKAYEIKLRMTIAASGQGRWGQELEFPEDCRASGYTPVLVVLDPTPNAKLTQLAQAFGAQGGEVHIGRDAWAHLESKAGATMGKFLQKYVHKPIEALLREVPEHLPKLVLQAGVSEFNVTVGTESFRIPRTGATPIEEEEDEGTIPLDADEQIPGP